MNRNSFLKLLIASPIFILVHSCFRSPQANGSGQIETEDNPLKITSMSGDHSHQKINVTENDVLIGAGGTFKLTGSNHSHNFIIQPHEMRQLRDGFRTFLFTFGSGDHEHSFFLNYQPKENQS